MITFMDSFSHYTSVGTKWDQVVLAGAGGATPDISMSYGLFAGACRFFGGTSGTGTSNQVAITKLFKNGNQAVVGCGFRFKIITFAGSATETFHQICGFLDSTTQQISVNVNQSGQIYVTRGGTILATSTNLLLTGNWYYIEVKATINGTTGAIEVRVNGTSTNWINISGVDTNVTANNFANAFQFGQYRNYGSGSLPIRFYVTDFALWDTTRPNGVEVNDFTGDLRIQACRPNGAGASTVWTPTGAASNYQAVNENPPDNDTSYNSSANPGDIDLFAMEDVTPTSGTVLGIQTNTCIRKDDAGVRTAANVIKSGSTTQVGANYTVQTQYVFASEATEIDPNNSPNKFTIATVNAIQAGYKEVA